jgi:hypothetical protein
VEIIMDPRQKIRQQHLKIGRTLPCNVCAESGSAESGRAALRPGGGFGRLGQGEER